MACRTKSGASGYCHSCGPSPFELLEFLEGLSNVTQIDLIGLDKYGSSEVRPKVRPKDMTGLSDELQTDQLRLVQSNPSERNRRNPQEIQVI